MPPKQQSDDKKRNHFSNLVEQCGGLSFWVFSFQINVVVKSGGFIINWWNFCHHISNCGGTFTTTYHIQGAGAPTKTTGKRQGYHVIISFSPEEKVTAEQAMYVLEHFAKDVLGDDYEAVYAVHTDREHMHGHLIWNSVSMTTGKKYNSPKSNWKNHLQPITNKYCDELGLSVMLAEYSRNPKNISRDKWEKKCPW